MVPAVSVQTRLEAVPALRALPPPVLTRLARAAIERALPRGAAAYMTGDPAEHLFLIRSGTMKLCLIARDGRETVSALVGPSETFGEGVERLRTHEARAVEPTRLLTMPLALLRGEPSFASLLDARLARTTQTLHAMTLGDTRERVAARLLELADRQGRPATDGTIVGVRLTQEDLGRMVGSSRETVNKVLGMFGRSGWVRRHGPRLIVTDAEALRELAGD
jgi:CRP/FNR family transcriptional regulator, cyclic AMP receptor protein